MLCEAWRLQRLDSGGGWAGGIPQPKNGPCGVLAVVHALILASQYSRARNVEARVYKVLHRCNCDPSDAAGLSGGMFLIVGVFASSFG